jgi:hypothetical protein
MHFAILPYFAFFAVLLLFCHSSSSQSSQLTIVTVAMSLSKNTVTGLAMSTANITHTGSTVSGGSLSSSAVEVPPIPNTIDSSQGGLRGPRAVLQQRVDQAAVVAREAAADADALESAHVITKAKHHEMFLWKAFGINPDDTPIANPGPIKTYKSVKSIEQYNDVVRILTHWGDDNFLTAAPENNSDVVLIRRFWKNNRQGYNYTKFFEIEETEALDGSKKIIHKSKNTSGIVLHMLDIFNIIKEAHCQQGHLRVDKTFAACKPMFYSPTYELCKIYCEGCYICHKKPAIEARKGAKKPIILSEFRNRFQVDLIDMRTMRKKDVCGQMQRWIMTVKDHSTGLVYLVALLWKKAKFVAAELERYFGFTGYPNISHTGMFSMLSLNQF